MEFKDFLNILLRRWRIVVLVMLLVSGSAVAGIFLLPKIYVTSTKLYMHSSALEDVGTLAGETHSLRGGDTADFTHLELMKNTKLLQELIDRLDLRSYSGAPLRVKKLLKSTPIISMFRPRPRISFSHMPESFVFVIEASSTDPRQAADMANTFAELYIQEVNAMRLEMFQQAIRNINDSLADLKRQYAVALQQQAEMRVEEGTADIGEEIESAIGAYYSLLDKKFSAVEQLSISLGAIEVIRKQLEGVDTGRIPGKAFDDHSTISNITSTIQELRSALAGALVEKTANHPDVVMLHKQLDELGKLLTHEVKVYQSTATDLEDAERTVQGYKSLVEGLDALLELYSKQLLTLPEKYARLTRYTADVRHIDLVLNNLGNSLSSLYAAQDRAHSLIKVSQPAMVLQKGDHEKPDETIFLAVGLLLGVLSGVGLACFIDYLDTSVRNPETLRQAGIPVLGVIPALGKRRDNPHAAAYRLLRNRISIAVQGRELRTLVLVAPTQGDGGAALARNLAALQAREGRGVLLLQFPEDYVVPAAAGTDAGAWNSWVGKGKEGFPDTLALNGKGFSAGSVPSCQALASLMDSLKAAYDIIVIDAPPLNMNDDILLLKDAVDALALVVSAGHVPLKAVMEAYEVCENSGIGILGAVLVNYKEEWLS